MSGDSKPIIKSQKVRHASADDIARHRVGEESAPLDLDFNDDDALYASANSGHVVLIPQRTSYDVAGHAMVTPSVEFDLGENGRVAISQEEADLIDQARAGKLLDSHIPAKELQKLAVDTNLRVYRPGEVGPPIPAWNELHDEKVVDIAKNAGYLDTLEQVERAIRHENQAKRRLDGRGQPGVPRDRVLRDLARLRQNLNGDIVVDDEVRAL